MQIEEWLEEHFNPSTGGYHFQPSEVKYEFHYNHVFEEGVVVFTPKMFLGVMPDSLLNTFRGRGMAVTGVPWQRLGRGIYFVADARNTRVAEILQELGVEPM